MYKLFDWPKGRHARLVVLTNRQHHGPPREDNDQQGDQHTGPDQDVVLAVQLQQIITSRLNKVKAFEEEALHPVSKKVAALSGDIWRCLDTEICEHSASHMSSTGLVGMSHVMEALDEMSSSSYIKANRRSSS
ncbi:origin recognition complex subunit 1-like [Coregonus clupeaformis]|uniref:origin recognition complex subunit 1-like n=1 Tax=Coregonus clupeaformis TaxID=59861 RepID=UPI001E1C4658|nr:origin recognition complex subunit 1-like [Coregonus clupeaformis]